ncbi:hypothetical protein [Cryobacterium shii]|uniref:hypothetical protein n=1 Tax=Cryobacterium shii TaxID=1259235 RepID=UPI0013588BE7|nr:hypothetical protein [Cryobacterium shii]
MSSSMAMGWRYQQSGSREPGAGSREPVAGFGEVGEVAAVEPGDELAEFVPELHGLIVVECLPVVGPAGGAEFVHVEEVGQDRFDVDEAGVESFDTHRIKIILVVHLVIPSSPRSVGQ